MDNNVLHDAPLQIIVALPEEDADFIYEFNKKIMCSEAKQKALEYVMKEYPWIRSGYVKNMNIKSIEFRWDEEYLSGICKITFEMTYSEGFSSDILNKYAYIETKPKKFSIIPNIFKRKVGVV